MRDLSKPTTPSDEFLRQVEADVAHLAKSLTNPEPVSDGAPESLVKKMEAAWEETRPQILETAHFIHAHPETGYREFQAVAHLKEVLEAHGITVTTPAFGVETAMYARYEALPAATEIPGFVGPDDYPEGTLVTTEDGSVRPVTVAFLSEYDALPDIGHGCGHNVICAAGLGAFLTLVRMHRNDPSSFCGRLEWYGTPAEEGFSGKCEMISGGAFTPGSIDAALMTHGFDTDIADMTWLGRREGAVTFTGVSAHASSAPFMGRNAVDAATLAYQAVGLLRQQLAPSERIHLVITDGGRKPSIIPETSRMEFYVRSKFPASLANLSSRLQDIFEGAALMSGCGVNVEWDTTPVSLSQRPAPALTAAWVRAVGTRGRHPVAPGVIPDVRSASTDFGNVSFLVPGIQPLIGVGPGNLHTHEFCASAGGVGGDAAAEDAAYGLARVGLDVLTDPATRKAAREYFDQAGGPLLASDIFKEQGQD